jgi:N-acetylneuraminate synthase
MEFTTEQWQALANHAKEKGLIFLSSPFSIEAVDLLERIGMPAWKVASGEVNNKSLLNRMLQTGKPILLSTGMSGFDEIDNAVSYIRQKNADFAVMQCTTAYPCPPEKVGLNLLPLLRERYQCAIGLSDHSGVIYPGLAAVTLGIEILEVHVTLSRDMFGPDIPASVTTGELGQLVEGVRFIERMRSHPMDKDAFAGEAQPLRNLFTKSIVASVDLPKGTVLEEKHLRIKKPGTGLPGERMKDLIGKQLMRDIKMDEQILEGDFS